MLALTLLGEVLVEILDLVRTGDLRGEFNLALGEFERPLKVMGALTGEVINRPSLLIRRDGLVWI